MTKYCGYEIGDINKDQLHRLFTFLHQICTDEDLIKLNDKELHIIAEEERDKWW